MNDLPIGCYENYARRYSGELKQVVDQAFAMARQLRHSEVTNFHVLLTALRADGGVALLKEFGIADNAIREAREAATRVIDQYKPKLCNDEELCLNYNAMQVVALASAESLRCRRQGIIELSHWLYGLIAYSKELAGTILVRYGFIPKRVRPWIDRGCKLRTRSGKGSNQQATSASRPTVSKVAREVQNLRETVAQLQRSMAVLQRSVLGAGTREPAPTYDRNSNDRYR